LETLRPIIKKLTSQVLLFSLGMAILLVLLARLLGAEGNTLILAFLAAFLFIFGVAMTGYLRYEQRQRAELKQQAARAESEPASQRLRASTHEISNLASPHTVKVWTWPPPPGPGGSRDVAIAPSGKRAGARYRVGDTLTVFFEASQDCYLTLLNIGTSGKLTILFPNALHRDNFIAANELHRIPGPEDGFEYQLQGPPGVEKLKAIATRTRVELLESSFAPDGSLFLSVQPAEGARNIAVIRKKVERLPPAQWAEAEWEFTVE
jgi:hypothetical protein